MCRIGHDIVDGIGLIMYRSLFQVRGDTILHFTVSIRNYSDVDGIPACHIFRTSSHSSKCS